MVVCQNCGATNEVGLAICATCAKPLATSSADSLSALRRLAALNNAGPQIKSSPADARWDIIPDWLELLLAKYGEDASMLTGIKPPPSPPPIELLPDGEDSSRVTSLLEQMATGIDTESPEERLATSMDWGKSAEEEEDWLSQLKSQQAPPITTTEEVSPDWLSEIASMKPAVKEPISPREDVEPPIETQDMPDWLKDLTPPTSFGSSEDLSVPSQPPEPAVSDDEIPDWLRELDMALPDTETQFEEQIPPATGSVDRLTEFSDVGERAELEEKDRVPPEAGLPAAEIPTSLEDTGDDIPDWLAQLAVVSPSKPEEAKPSVDEDVEGPPIIESEIPDWLRDIAADAATSAQLPAEPLSLEPEEATPQEPEPETPDWLTSLREDKGIAATLDAEYIPDEEAEETEEPQWLAELRGTQDARILQPSEEVTEIEEDALPDWLAELRASRLASEAPPAKLETPEEPEIVQEAVEETEEAFDWLAELPDIEAIPAEDEEAEIPSVELEQPEVDETGALDWLAELEGMAAVPEVADRERLAPEEETPPLPGEEIPDWLREEVSQEAAPPPPAERPSVAEEVPVAAEGVAPAEIPDWLRDLEPREESPPESVETEGVLAGLPGLLPAVEEDAPAKEDPITTVRSRLAMPQVPDVEGAELFRGIAAEQPLDYMEGEVVPAPGPESRRRRLGETLLWAFIFIVLIVAIALAILAVSASMEDILGGSTFREFFGSPLVIDPADVNTFRTQVNKLSPNAVVVVSFDYSPATAGEMDPLAEVIVRDLLESQARVVAVSLRPEGAGMAQRLLNNFQDEYPYGEHTLNLGYLSGQMAGVRSLAFLSTATSFQGQQPVADYPAWRDVVSLDDVALIVDVSDNPLTVRWWVEQVGPGTLANRSVVAAVSSAADPTVRPYYNQIDPKMGQLHGLISGVTGAAAYENRVRQPGRATNSLAAQSIAHLGLVVAGLGGTLVGFRTQAIKRSRD